MKKQLLALAAVGILGCSVAPVVHAKAEPDKVAGSVKVVTASILGLVGGLNLGAAGLSALVGLLLLNPKLLGQSILAGTVGTICMVPAVVTFKSGLKDFESQPEPDDN